MGRKAGLPSLTDRQIIVLPIFLDMKSKTECGRLLYTKTKQVMGPISISLSLLQVLSKIFDHLFVNKSLWHSLISEYRCNKLYHIFHSFHLSALRLMVHTGRCSFNSSSSRCENLVPKSLRKSPWIFQWLKMLKLRQE